MACFYSTYSKVAWGLRGGPMPARIPPVGAGLAGAGWLFSQSPLGWEH